MTGFPALSYVPKHVKSLPFYILKPEKGTPLDGASLISYRP